MTTFQLYWNLDNLHQRNVILAGYFPGQIGNVSSQCSDKRTFDLIVTIPNPNEIFSDTIITIANETIPKTTSSPRIHKPWFNDTCRSAIKARKKAERILSRNPKPQNLDCCRKARAKARRTIKY